MTMDPNDPNRPLGADPYHSNRRMADEGVGWGLPAAVAAVVLIIGGMFLFASSGDRTQTAANNDAAPVTRNAPAPTPAPMTPPAAPTTTPKQ